jgi:hypothetical protein
MTSKRALVTTTVNVPTNLREWANGLGMTDHLIVVGDVQTPHTEVGRLLTSIEADTGVQCAYVHPGVQTPWETERVVGYRSIQRRNLGYLEALRLDADVVITVDDDNFPMSWIDPTNAESWINEITPMLTAPSGPHQLLRSSHGWYNPGQLCVPTVTHRGYPIGRRAGMSAETTVPSEDGRVGVFAALWLGDPDVDAIERIANNTTVSDVTGDVTLHPDTWAPFNSQATAIRADLLPACYLWPEVGRYDDIWASYVARTVMCHTGDLVRYGYPLVEQRRNEHDLVTDLERELLGMRHTPELITVLGRCDIEIAGKCVAGQSFTVTELTTHVFHRVIEECRWLPARTADGFTAWLHDLEQIGVR